MHVPFWMKTKLTILFTLLQTLPLNLLKKTKQKKQEGVGQWGGGGLNLPPPQCNTNNHKFRRKKRGGVEYTWGGELNPPPKSKLSTNPSTPGEIMTSLHTWYQNNNTTNNQMKRNFLILLNSHITQTSNITLGKNSLQNYMILVKNYNHQNKSAKIFCKLIIYDPYSMQNLRNYI